MSNDSTIPNGFKRCSRGDGCVHPDGPILPLTKDFFYSAKGKFVPECKACRTDYLNRNRDKINAQRRSNDQKNGEHVRERKREWYRNNRDKQNEYRKRWQANNPSKYSLYLSKRNRGKLIGTDYAASDLFELYLSQKGLCWWCGEKLRGKFDIDHRLPLARGGIDALGNICLSCARCNRGRKDRLPSEWSDRLL